MMLAIILVTGVLGSLVYALKVTRDIKNIVVSQQKEDDEALLQRLGND